MKFFFTLLVIFILLGLFSIYPILLLASSQDVDDCVVKTERVVDGDGDGSKYMIFGKKEVYENVDSLIRLKFNSADFYRDVEAGKCYTFSVQGWRVPFLSWTRNIYKIN